MNCKWENLNNCNRIQSIMHVMEWFNSLFKSYKSMNVIKKLLSVNKKGSLGLLIKIV